MPGATWLYHGRVGESPIERRRFCQQSGDKKSALDKLTLEAYVRHLIVWGPQIKISIADAKPAAIAGMLEVSIGASAVFSG